MDKGENDTSGTFTIDRSGPADTSSSLNASSDTVSFSAGPDACLDRVELGGIHSLGNHHDSVSCNQGTTCSGSFTGVPPNGNYSLTTYDCAGNRSVKTVKTFPAPRGVQSSTFTFAREDFNAQGILQLGEFATYGAKYVAVNYSAEAEMLPPPPGHNPDLPIVCFDEQFTDTGVGVLARENLNNPPENPLPPIVWNKADKCDEGILAVRMGPQPIPAGTVSSCSDSRTGYQDTQFGPGIGYHYLRFSISATSGNCKSQDLASYGAARVTVGPVNIVIGPDESVPIVWNGFNSTVFDEVLFLFFREVTARGQLFVDHLDMALTERRLLNIASNVLDVNTTAGYSGEIEATIKYDPAQVSQADERRLRMFKVREDNTLEDITVSVDVLSKTIKGVTTSLGKFAVGLDTSAPTVPANLAVATLSSASVQLSWSASQDNDAVAGYQVFRNSAQIAVTTGTFYLDQGLSVLTTYAYVLTAFDVWGNTSAVSAAVSTMTFPPAAALFVTGSTVLVNGQPELTFVSTQPIAVAAVSTAGALGGQVIATATAQGLAPVGTIYDLGPEGAAFSPPGRLTFHYSTGAIPSGAAETDLKLYHYLTATQGLELVPNQTQDLGIKTLSAPISAFGSVFLILSPGGTPPPDLLPPTTSFLTLTFVTTTEIGLAWSSAADNVGVEGYKVFRNGVQVATRAVNAFADAGLAPSTAYSYAVSAFDAAGNASGLSNFVSTTTLSVSTAAEVVGLIREDCAGFNNCFNSLREWEENMGGVDFGTCTVGNLVCLGKSAVAKIDGAWVNADTQPVVFNGWDTNANNRIRVYTATAARHSGTLGTGYRMEMDYETPIIVQENFITVDGLSFHKGGSNPGDIITVDYETSLNSRIEISNCYLRGDYSGAIYGIVVDPGNNNQKTVYLWNNILENFKGSGRVGIAVDYGTVHAYNNTVVNSRYGIKRGGGALIAKNNLCYNNVTDFSGTFSSSSTHNLSKDQTAPAFGAYYRGAAVVFVSTTNNFHLVNTGTGAVNKGIDLAASFNTDIDGQSRTPGAWDIGADEYSAGGLGAPAFNLAQQQESPPPAPFIDPAFKLGEVYAFPNPAYGGRRPTIHVECGLAEGVELRIYDVAGELLHEARFPDQPLVVDNKYAYEYTWDDPGVPSGVYVYVVLAQKTGEAPIKVIKKLAVVK